ncbi:hypothetical protein MNBD_BACTEROID06-1088 [hydrothermal vent metagenome]|uniref:Uncharacterized protein n=1 Tax=hydrothermal vent metagenome TaxID=652676 RepID=A0A3B0UA94_9ZZZZ
MIQAGTKGQVRWVTLLLGTSLGKLFHARSLTSNITAPTGYGQYFSKMPLFKAESFTPLFRTTDNDAF